VLVSQALEVARRFHGAQVDLLGEDYVDGHLARVVANLARFGDEDLSAAGALHDVIEDTAATPALLLGLGVPARVVSMVEVVTKAPDEKGSEGYRRFIARICSSGDLGAVRLKLHGDLADHLRPIGTSEGRRLARLMERYREAEVVLVSAEAALLQTDGSSLSRA
jgi:hypothetical protein